MQILKQALEVAAGVPIAFAIFGVITVAVTARIGRASRKQVMREGV
jgi:hypothetical protein